MGTRMGSNFSNSPKTFIKLNGKKILEIQLDGLKKQGFKMVIIVIGYLEEKFKKEIGSCCPHFGCRMLNISNGWLEEIRKISITDTNDT